MHHNVVDGRTDDPLAYSARFNWDLKGHMGYEEGALRQTTCGWVASVGAWGHYFVDHLVENPLVKKMDRLTWGVDAAVGYGGFSLTAAYSGVTWDNSDLLGTTFDGFSWLVQVGYLFPDTAWEIAARYDAQSREYDVASPYKTFGATEFAVRGELLHRRARRQADARRLASSPPTTTGTSWRTSTPATTSPTRATPCSSASSGSSRSEPKPRRSPPSARSPASHIVRAEAGPASFPASPLPPPGGVASSGPPPTARGRPLLARRRAVPYKGPFVGGRGPPGRRAEVVRSTREVRMKFGPYIAAATGLLAAFAAPARADGSLEQRMTAVEQQLASSSTPSSREIQSSVDAYLASAKADATLVGGPGSAGYDGGFWIRGGSFLLKTNLTLQTRYEYFDWNDRNAEPSPGGDLSGFSLPRATLKFSGDATCDIHYYTELEFGHAGTFFNDHNNSEGSQYFFSDYRNTHARRADRRAHLATSEGLYGILREGWIEYEAAPAFAFRMGLLKTAATRQLMTPPEMQQFVDISMASGYIGQSMPGYTDRNRDYGFMLHGVLGCDGDWSYMLTVTNGDGPVHHNVVDGSTDDPLAYSARVNWDIVGHAGYEEGALRQTTCGWVASVGGWAHYFVDHLRRTPWSRRPTA